MSTRNFVLGTAMLFPLFSAVPAQAQRVNADIIIGGGPIAGRVIIGDRDRDGYRGRPRPIRRVEWISAREYRRDDWWRRFQRESRIIVVFWDRDDDSYYLDRYRSDLLELRVYERGGRFYRLEEDRYDGRYDDRYRHDNRRYDDRYRHDNRRYDDRYNDRPWNDGWDDRRNDRDDRRDKRRDKGHDNRRDKGHDNRWDDHGRDNRRDND